MGEVGNCYGTVKHIRDLMYGVSGMPKQLSLPATEMIRLGDLHASDYNPREITDEQMLKLRKTIREDGFLHDFVANRRPDGRLVIISGHQRAVALRLEGYDDNTEVPCKILQVKPSVERRLNLALNKIGGRFEDDKLRAVLRYLELQEDADEQLDMTGFDEKELDDLLKESAKAGFDDDALADANEPTVHCPQCGADFKFSEGRKQ